MRILHVIDFFQPQLGYQETYLVKAQMEKGHTVRVITSDRYSPILYKGCALQQVLGDRKKGDGHFIEEGIDVVRLSGQFEYLTNIWLSGLEKRVMEFNPDTIHVHGIPSITAIRISMLKKDLKETKLIFDDHMTFNAVRGVYVLPFYKVFKHLFCKTIMKNADGIVAVTNETRQFMEKMYGIPSNRISVIPLGCDTSRFYRDSNWRRALRESWGIKDDEVVFCYAGKIIQEKGLHILVKAALELLKTNENIKILFVGGRDTEYFKLLMQEIAKSKFNDKFIFIPAVPNNELYKYYSTADIGIWPKQCSLTMLEAMACGLPVIISNNSGALERIDEGKNGFVYAEGDANNLKSRMKILLNKINRINMGRNARNFAENNDWKKISNSFETMYLGKGDLG